MLASLSDDSVGPLNGQDSAGLVRRGARALASGFESPEGGPHVVPLSGGLDSRAILASLLGAGAHDDVVAVTIGTPGTFDWEIARQVAARAKVRHELIDLRNVHLDENALERALVTNDAASWAFDVFYHRLIPEHFGSDATYWSGFMGGELGGAHVPTNAFSTWEGAVRSFVGHGAFCPGRSSVRPGFSPESQLPRAPCCDEKVLPYGDQVDFGVRQESYIRRTVVAEGYDYRTPFLAEPWIRFILAVPHQLRRQELLYKRILLSEFPSLFSLPTTNNAGLPITASPSRVTARIRVKKVGVLLRAVLKSPASLRTWRPPALPGMLNYLNFTDALRSRPDVRELLLGLVRALDARGVVPWLRVIDVWNAHERAGFGYDGACPLTLLASLELNLRADRVRPTPLFDVPD